LPKNIYNIDKIGIILYIFNSIKILIDKNDPRDYKNIDIKRTIIITIKYININDRFFLLMII
jgi:hypothetical protein